MTDRVVEVFRALSLEPDQLREGRRFWVLCPFHEDKHPSLAVKLARGPGRGWWRCYACGEHGSLADMVMRRLGLTFPGAKRWLEEFDVGQEPQKPPPPGLVLDAGKTRKKGYVLPAGVIFGALEDWPTPPQAYARERGITPEQVERWGIGWAAQGRLAGRLVFVLRSKDGRPLSYMARSFSGEEPRYLHPDKYEGADRAAFFGDAGWTDDRSSVVVVEGAPDGLAVERATGLPFGALPSASELHPAHVMRISTFPLVLVLTDHDDAGEKMAHQLHYALGRHSQVRRVTLEPQGTGKVDANSVPEDYLRRRVELALHRRDDEP